MLRPIGDRGNLGTVFFAASVVIAVLLLRCISLRLISPSNGKEVLMEKTLFFSAIFETTWAVGVSIVAGHLST